MIRCRLLGHRPVARSVSTTHAIHRWTSCSRCRLTLDTPERSARLNRRHRRALGIG